jgi:hypothetical protein
MFYTIGFLTVGDPNRRTGGYLYHREVFRRWRAQGHRVDEIVLGPADVASFRKHDENGKGIASHWYPQTLAHRLHDLQPVAHGSMFAALMGWR